WGLLAAEKGSSRTAFRPSPRDPSVATARYVHRTKRPSGPAGTNVPPLRALLTAPAIGARLAAATPASQPGARPLGGNPPAASTRPALASDQDTTELEFHISPNPNSSRPHTGVGTSATSCNTCAIRC